MVKTIKLADLPFSCRFYYKGKKYMQVIRVKRPIGAFKIVCAELPQGRWVKMPSGRVVKPIVKVELA